MNILKDKLIQTINECDLHSKRINSAHNKMKVFMPLTEHVYSNLTEDEIEHIDQYLFRFAKLQDAIGQSLFKNVLLFLGEIIENKSFIDIFHRLEQLEIIENYDRWLELRVVRNELAHEYGNDPLENAIRINKIYNLKDDLTLYFSSITEYLERKKYFRVEDKL